MADVKPVITRLEEYEKPLLVKLGKKFMKDGKWEMAQKIVINGLEKACNILVKEGVKIGHKELFEKVILNGSPKFGVKSKRFRGSNCQVPVPLTVKEGENKAISYILNSSRKKKGYDISTCLSHILVDTFKEQGDVIKLRNESHKQSEAQKAFAHLTHLLIKKETEE